ELLTLLHLPEEAMAEGMSYTVICSVGYIFISAYNVLGSVFRGIGDSRTPLIAVIISCIVNIGGDLLLCGVFKMAAAGAAIATVFAQAVSVFLSLAIAAKKGLPFSFGRSNIRPHFAIMKRIVKLGMPVAIQSLVVAFSFLIMGAVVNDLGVNASAGYGIGGKLITFILLFPDACSQALSSYAAQNVGAGKYDRAQRALFHCVWMSLTFSVFSFCFAFFKGDLLVQIFTSDPLVIPEGAANLKAYAFDTFLTSVMFCLIGYFNAFGKTFITLIQGVLGVCLRIAAALIFKAVLFNVFTVSLSTPIASFGQLVLLGSYFLYFRKKLKKQQIQSGVTV
ncbi:MAG: polysaccharide biosynthesis C-terminal domain-containing protein, partial [Parasporobacterium sp.]|nr:polysaccharide biosynthesis C-terminal domain-containing protein [Parasporobacterium sp.]